MLMGAESGLDAGSRFATRLATPPNGVVELRTLRRLAREQDPKSPFVFASERGVSFTTVGFAGMAVAVLAGQCGAEEHDIGGLAEVDDKGVRAIRPQVLGDLERSGQVVFKTAARFPLASEGH